MYFVGWTWSSWLWWGEIDMIITWRPWWVRSPQNIHQSWCAISMSYWSCCNKWDWSRYQWRWRSKLRRCDICCCCSGRFTCCWGWWGVKSNQIHWRFGKLRRFLRHFDLTLIKSECGRKFEACLSCLVWESKVEEIFLICCIYTAAFRNWIWSENTFSQTCALITGDGLLRELIPTSEKIQSKRAQILVLPSLMLVLLLPSLFLSHFRWWW